MKRKQSLETKLNIQRTFTEDEKILYYSNVKTQYGSQLQCKVCSKVTPRVMLYTHYEIRHPEILNQEFEAQQRYLSDNQIWGEGKE